MIMGVENKGIPTFYGGFEFRSRQEAKWAVFFDQIDWEWEYEPIDLKGYIPDFVLKFANAPVLVEVKAAMTLAELRKSTGKIDSSGWDHDALILGGFIDDVSVRDAYPMFGLARQNACDKSGTAVAGSFVWGPALLHLCRECSSYSYHHSTGNWFCAQCGVKDAMKEPKPDMVDHHWNMAHELTKWNPRKK